MGGLIWSWFGLVGIHVAIRIAVLRGCLPFRGCDLLVFGLGDVGVVRVCFDLQGTRGDFPMGWGFVLRGSGWHDKRFVCGCLLYDYFEGGRVV